MDKNVIVAKEVFADIMQNGIRQQCYRLKKASWEKIKDLTPQQAFALKPGNVEEKSWEKLVNIWFYDHYQVT